jgi:hypothetical protein
MKEKIRCELDQYVKFTLVVIALLFNFQCRRYQGPDIIVYFSSQDLNLK